MKDMRNYLGAIAALWLIGLVAGGAAWASTSATITGRVTDQQGLAIPDAQVEVTNIHTNITHAGKTDAGGLFRISNLPPGEYRVIVQKEGFASIAKPGVELHVQDIITLNFSMQVGSVTQTVTVESGAPLVQTESGSVGTVIDRRFVERLPLNGRSFNTLLQLTPGVVVARTPPFRDANEAGQFSINGQRTTSNYFTVDGVGANFGVDPGNRVNASGGGGLPALSVYAGTSGLVSADAMEEFRVETSTFAAEFGRAPGGQIIISTRSGTNEFHGGLFEYFRNDKLDANDWFANAAGLPRAPERQNDFGGFLGGPILRNKTFFFFSYEGLRLRLPQTTVVRVPSLALRAAAVPAAAPYLNAYPQPNGPSVSAVVTQFTGSFSNSATLDAPSIRLDHALSSKVIIFGRYNDAPSSGASRSGALNQISTTNLHARTATAGANMRFTQVVVSIRGNYSVQTGSIHTVLDSFMGATPPPANALLPAPLSVADSIGRFSSPETSGFGLGSVAENRQRQFNLVGDAGIEVGTHQLKFGLDYRQLLLKREPALADIQYSITSLQNFAATGVADRISTFALRPGKLGFHAVSLFGQDTWRVGQRLAVTYGVRWEFDPAPRGEDGTILAAWTNVDDPATTALAPAGAPLWKSRFGNFAPRLGVAYRLTAKGDLVVRGGWGLFYDLGTGAVGNLLLAFPNTTSLLRTALALPVVDASTIVPPLPSLQPPFPNLTEGFSPTLKLPRSYQWNVTVERALSAEQSLSIAYVGQDGSNLLRRTVAIRPNPSFSNFFILTANGDSSNYHAMQVQFRRRLSKGLQALANYTWSHSTDTNSEDTLNLSASSVITSSNRGSSNFDVRHSFSAAFSYELPRIAKEGLLAKLTHDWSLDTILLIRSGFPFHVTASGVVIPGVTGGIRPDIVPGQPVWLRDEAAPGGKRLNPAAFAIPPQARQGTLGRNSIGGFGLVQTDFSIARRFPIWERLNLQFRADFFNIFNHPNFADPAPRLVGGSLVDGQATQMLNRGIGGLSPIYQVGGPRSVQLSLRLTF